MPQQDQSYEQIWDEAQTQFLSKAEDYGTSWRKYEAKNITDKILIKITRVRTIQKTGEQKVTDKGNDIRDEFVGIMNYSFMELVQLETAQEEMLPIERLKELYAEHRKSITELKEKKNHDYGAVWKMMRISSIAAEIDVKLERVITMEKRNTSGNSEGIDSCLMDIANYANFAVQLIDAGKDPKE